MPLITLSGAHLAGTTLYTEQPQRMGELRARYAAIDTELAAALARWEILASRAAA